VKRPLYEFDILLYDAERDLSATAGSLVSNECHVFNTICFRIKTEAAASVSGSR